MDDLIAPFDGGEMSLGPGHNVRLKRQMSEAGFIRSSMIY